MLRVLDDMNDSTGDNAASPRARERSRSLLMMPREERPVLLMLAVALSSFLCGRMSTLSTEHAHPHSEHEAEPPRGRRLEQVDSSCASRQEQLSRLEWVNTMLQLRGWRVSGPMPVRCLKPEEVALFGRASAHAFDTAVDGRHSMSYGQVPPAAQAHMVYQSSQPSAAQGRAHPSTAKPPAPHARMVDQSTSASAVSAAQAAQRKQEGVWVRSWSAALVDQLTSVAAQNGSGVSPSDYPLAAECHYSALDEYPVRGMEVMVAGSVSPWVEAIALSRGAAAVTTADYQLPRVGSQRLTSVSMGALRSRPHEFDALFSFSSIEHDGLGRYGDPIHPLGDHAAMGEFALLLRPRGVLYLGVPVGGLGSASSGCRVYDKHRFASLTRGWELLATYAPHPSCVCATGARRVRGSLMCCPSTLHPHNQTRRWGGSSFWSRGNALTTSPDHWMKQPLFVLRKTADALGAALHSVGTVPSTDSVDAVPSVDSVDMVPSPDSVDPVSSTGSVDPAASTQSAQRPLAVLAVSPPAAASRHQRAASLADAALDKPVVLPEYASLGWNNYKTELRNAAFMAHATGRAVCTPELRDGATVAHGSSWSVPVSIAYEMRLLNSFVEVRPVDACANVSASCTATTKCKRDLRAVAADVASLTAPCVRLHGCLYPTPHINALGAYERLWSHLLKPAVTRHRAERALHQLGLADAPFLALHWRFEESMCPRHQLRIGLCVRVLPAQSLAPDQRNVTACESGLGKRDAWVVGFSVEELASAVQRLQAAHGSKYVFLATDGRIRSANNSVLIDEFKQRLNGTVRELRDCTACTADALPTKGAWEGLSGSAVASTLQQEVEQHIVSLAAFAVGSSRSTWFLEAALSAAARTHNQAAFRFLATVELSRRFPVVPLAKVDMMPFAFLGEQLRRGSRCWKP